jgi:hypothetical protein
VRLGNRGDDREPEPVTVLRAGALWTKAPEGLGELRHGRVVKNDAGAVNH